jgi:hypothetical protein
MKRFVNIIPLALIFMSCGNSEYKNSNSNPAANSADSGKVERQDSSKRPDAGGYPVAPSHVDSTGGQSGNMSDTYKDTARQKGGNK